MLPWIFMCGEATGFKHAGTGLIKPVVEEFLKVSGLELSPEKTVTTYIKNGFTFLGQTFRKHGKFKGWLINKYRTASGREHRFAVKHQTGNGI
jgi:hypothetical protein